MIDFDCPPPIATILRLDDQTYELVQVMNHTRKDGSPTSLLVWLTSCPSCGEQFEQPTGLKAKGINRRCSSCKSIGRPVKGKRGRKVKVEVRYP